MSGFLLRSFCHIEFFSKWCLLLSSSSSGQIGFSMALLILCNDSAATLLSAPIFHKERQDVYSWLHWEKEVRGQ